jgi:hypothetical protein
LLRNATHRPHHIQGASLRRHGGVADACCLRAPVREPSSPKWRLVRTGQTAPLNLLQLSFTLEKGRITLTA